MNFSSNRFWQITAIVIISVGILLLGLGGYFNQISNMVLNPVTGTMEWIYIRVQAVSDLINSPDDLTELQAHNLELKAEIAELQSEIIQYQENQKDYEIISALLDFATEELQNEYMTALVIARDSSPFLRYIIVNKGSDDGILRGMPVVNEQGLIGRVSSVATNAARIQLITDPASNVNVVIQPNNVAAVVSGSVTGELSVEMIAQDAVINPDDIGLTMGIGSNFPGDIVVGAITSVRKQATALFQEATIESRVDFDSLKLVLIIVSFEPVDISTLIE